jgi:hypothetical protein
MGMKEVTGSGSTPIAKSISPTLVNAPNSHPSGENGAVAHNTVTQPKSEGNRAKSVTPNLVSHANCYDGGKD